MNETFIDSDGHIIRNTMVDEHSIIKITEKVADVKNVGKIISGETNSNILTFETNRYYDNVDLSAKNIRFIVSTKWVDDPFSRDASNVQHSTNLLRFSWVIDNSITQVDGIVSVAIEFFDETYSLKTMPFTIKVDKSLSVGDVAVEVPENWFISLESRVIALENKTESAIEEVVEKYLTENPVESVSDEHIAEVSVASYSGNEFNTAVASCIENNTTVVKTSEFDSKLTAYLPDYFKNNPVEGDNPSTEVVANDSILLASVTADGLNEEWYDIYKYPPIPTWGHEYLYSWYEKLYSGKKVVICAEGDSTTYEGFWNTGGERRTMFDKIMKLGNYTSYTIENCGYGSGTSGHWVGTWDEDGLSELANPKCTKALYPNGTLDSDMSKNPDLIIWSFGINDASTNLFPNDTIAQRLTRFKANLIEGLQRIRGNKAINGRPAYNKSAEELAIILCVPVTTYTPSIGKTRDLWTKYTRRIIQEACREYKCGFWDISMRHYDHEFSTKWSVSTSGTGYDGTHPRPACNADFVSSVQDLLFPICLWKEKVEITTTTVSDLSEEGVSINVETGATSTSTYSNGVTDFIPISIGDKVTISAFSVVNAATATFYLYNASKEYLACIACNQTDSHRISAGQTVDTTNKFMFDFSYDIPDNSKITDVAYIRAVSWKNDLIDTTVHPFYVKIEHIVS